jgi:hypothetical protein
LTKEPLLYVYDTEGPDYEKVWVHSSKRQFLEARPWLIFWLSMGLLNPKYSYDTIIEIPSKCPLVDSDNLEQDFFISDRLKSLVYYQDDHQIALKEKDKYTEFFESDSGVYRELNIPFLPQDSFLTISIYVSILLA